MATRYVVNLNHSGISIAFSFFLFFFQTKVDLPTQQCWGNSQQWITYSATTNSSHSHSHSHRYTILTQPPAPTPSCGVDQERRAPVQGKLMWPVDGKKLLRWDELGAQLLATTLVLPLQPGESFMEEQTGLPSEAGLCCIYIWAIIIITELSLFPYIGMAMLELQETIFNVHSQRFCVICTSTVCFLSCVFSLWHVGRVSQ